MRRPIVADAPPLADLPLHEAPDGTAPVQSHATVRTPVTSATLAARGIPEVSVLQGHGEAVRIMFTVLRAVGWLSRHDLRSRRAGAGPPLPTPDAQCLGRHDFDLQVRLAAPQEDGLATAAAASRFRAPLRANQVTVAPGVPAQSSALGVSGALVTAWKPAESGGGSVLRLSNPTAQPRQVALRWPDWAQRITPVRFDETPAGPPGRPDFMELSPFEVVSLHIAGGPDPGRSQE